MRLFNSVRTRKPKRNVFDLSHERKFTCNMGELIPILCEEVIPGDSFRLNSEMLLRMSPLVAPAMHSMNIYTHFFYVPNRLIWNEWEDFITAGDKGDKQPLMPYFEIRGNYGSLGHGTLADYMGMATLPAPTLGDKDYYNITALPFRAYNLIFNEYYRDENLQDEIICNKTSSLDDNWSSYNVIQKRNWERDYFTSALPWTQKGPEVSMPLGGEIDVTLGNPPHNPMPVRTPNGNPAPDGDLTVVGNTLYDVGAGSSVVLDPNGELKVDLNQGGTTINDLRRSLRLQQWLERNARAGSRYVEHLLAHFGVKSSDQRLDRPEYLGGGKSPVVISEVLQTSQTDPAVSPQGNMAGHGIGVGNTNQFKKYFEEHGYVIGLVSVMPRSTYMNGTRRHFFKNDKFDFYFPEFANVGEQEVYNEELFCDYYNATADQKGTFGYQSRYAEYKFIPSTVHGDFKNITGLGSWHLGRNFDTLPPLNNEFVSTQDIDDRIFAVTDPTEHKLYCQVYNNLKAIRPMPKFGTPIL